MTKVVGEKQPLRRYGMICNPTYFVKFIGNGQARLRCARGGRVSQMEGIPVHQAQLPCAQRH